MEYVIEQDNESGFSRASLDLEFAFIQIHFNILSLQLECYLTRLSLLHQNNGTETAAT